MKRKADEQIEESLSKPGPVRDSAIMRASVVGVIVNFLLAAFKAVVEITTHSIAITLDAVNNLSDALSSGITIAGTKLASKSPDRKHPYGYGRVEYINAVIVSVIVLYAGITAFSESVERIVHPQTAHYGTVALVIIAVAVLVKILLGRYVKTVGVKVNSNSLIGFGTDSQMDALISASTLLAAFIYIVWGVSLEAWLGAIIAVVIVKAGIGILHETLSGILGERIDGNLSRGVKQAICEMEGVRGADDLLLTDYGPERLQGSVYIEVDDAMTARDIDLLTRRIKQMVLLRFNVIITAVGIYSANSAGAKAALLRDSIEAIAKRYEHVLGLHGFYLDKPMRCVYFDIIIDFAAADREEEYRAVMNDVREAYPGYTFTTTMDSNVSD